MNRKFQKIIGIDPGLATTGFAVLDYVDKQPRIIDLGVIITAAKTPFPERLAEIYRELEVILDTHQPQVLVAEKLIFVKNVTNGLAVAHARGLIISAAARRGMTVVEILPKDIKIKICGYGNAPKIQVQRMVQKIFGLSKLPKPDDAADALAVAYSVMS